MLQVGVSLRPDSLQALFIHQFRCSWDLSDEESVGKPDDVCSQGDSWNLEERADTNTHEQDVYTTDEARLSWIKRRHRTQNYLFTDIKQCLVELFVNTPEDVEVKDKETTDASILISLVNLRRFP